MSFSFGGGGRGITGNLSWWLAAKTIKTSPLLIGRGLFVDKIEAWSPSIDTESIMRRYYPTKVIIISWLGLAWLGLACIPHQEKWLVFTIASFLIHGYGSTKWKTQRCMMHGLKCLNRHAIKKVGKRRTLVEEAEEA